MPNQSIFKTSNKPLIGQAANTINKLGCYLPSDAATSAAVAGAFSIYAANSASLGLLGGTVNTSLQVVNPVGSGKRLFLDQVYCYISVALNLLSGFSGQLSILQGGSIGTSTSQTPANLVLGSSVASVTTAASSINTVSGGTTCQVYALYPGPFQIPLGGNIVVPPGQTITINVFGSLTLLGILGNGASVTWWEK
ncbi:hypothetical protein [Paenibacillus sp. FSL H8-0537]|uniref:hypothetical protein n=1 Tax=Paenibacillus sp. FSL H8-0537 TaxID=2921399 RepID=UPI0031010A2F